jgi:hypothetical protein
MSEGGSMDQPRLVTRRGLIATAAASGAVLGASPALAAEDVRTVGARAGEISFEFVGKLAQSGADFTGFGYLTRIAGLAASALFSAPAPNGETTAHFTFVSVARLTGRSELHNLEVLDADGDLIVLHRARPGADFSDPESFARGRRVAVFDAHFQSIVTEQTASEGSEHLAGQLRQRSARGFTVAGDRLRFGRRGARQAISGDGWSQRLSATGPTSQAWVAGLARPTGG